MNPAPSRLRVMLVDDHAVVRAGCRRLLDDEPGFAVVAEHDDGDAAYAALGTGPQPPVEVVVLDLALPGRSGLDLLRRITLRHPSVSVLVFSMHDGPAVIAHALAAGAAGYVTKSSDPEILARALHRVADGERPVLSPDVAGAAAGPATGAPHETLSPREFEVLLGLAHGHSVDEIAGRLRLSTKTIANYQTLVRQKLGLATPLQLLRYAQQHRLTTI